MRLVAYNTPILGPLPTASRARPGWLLLITLMLAALAGVAHAQLGPLQSVLPSGATTMRSFAARAADALTVRDFGAVGDGTTDDTASQQRAATAVASAGGGTIRYPAGTYLTSKTLLLSSNTRVRCDEGATLVAPATGSAPNIFFLNVDNAATSLTDHDISIEGCRFSYPNAIAQNPDHAVEMHFVQHVAIRFNSFSGGGNGTAMLGVDDVEVIGNYATGIQNACYDNWDGTTNIRIFDNACYLVNGVAGSFGIMLTGASTALADAPASGAQIMGNRIYTPGPGGACIELNVASDTSSVTRAQVMGNYCLVAPGVAAAGIQMGGNGGYHILTGNIIEGASQAPSIQDTDPTQHDDIVSDNILIGCGFHSPAQGNIDLNGTHNIVANNKFVGCTGTPFYTGDATSLIAGNDTGLGAVSTTMNVGALQATNGGATALGGGTISTPALFTGSIQGGGGGLGSVSVAASGSFSSPPNVFVGPPPTGGIQAAVAITDWGLSSVASIVAAGSGCSVPTFVQPVGGVGAAPAIEITAVDANGGVTTAIPYSAGDLSVMPPNPASFTANSGGCATLPAMILNYYVSGAKIANPGAGYTTPPSVAIYGTGGAGVVIKTTLAPASVAISGIPACSAAVAGTLCNNGTAVQVK